MPMIQFRLDLDEKRRLDVAAEFESLREQFPTVQLISQDALADRATHARNIVDELQLPEKLKRKITRTLDRNAERYGPAYYFSIPYDNGSVDGTLRPVDLSFSADATVSKQLWNGINEYVRGLEGGIITVYDDERSNE